MKTRTCQACTTPKPISAFKRGPRFVGSSNFDRVCRDCRLDVRFALQRERAREKYALENGVAP